MLISYWKEKQLQLVPLDTNSILMSLNFKLKLLVRGKYNNESFHFIYIAAVVSARESNKARLQELQVHYIYIHVHVHTFVFCFALLRLLPGFT